MPFAAHVGTIAGRLQSLRDGQAISVQITLILRQPIVPHHVADPGLVRIQPAQQAGPRRAAAAGIVKLGKSKTVLCQSVQVRGFYLAAEAAYVRIAHIIGHDQNNVGTVVATAELS